MLCTSSKSQGCTGRGLRLLLLLCHRLGLLQVSWSLSSTQVCRWRWQRLRLFNPPGLFCRTCCFAILLCSLISIRFHHLGLALDSEGSKTQLLQGRMHYSGAQNCQDAFAIMDQVSTFSKKPAYLVASCSLRSFSEQRRVTIMLLG
jgi:hypothetical protein